MWIEILKTYVGPLGSFLKGETRDFPPETARQLPKKSWKRALAPWEQQTDSLQKEIDDAHNQFRTCQQALIKDREELSGLEAKLKKLQPQLDKLDAIVKRDKKKKKGVGPRVLLMQKIMNAERAQLVSGIKLAKLDIEEAETWVKKSAKLLKQRQAKKATRDKAAAEAAAAKASADAGPDGENNESETEPTETASADRIEGTENSPHGSGLRTDYHGIRSSNFCRRRRR